MKRRILIYTLIACAILIPQLDHDRFLVLYDIRDHKALMDIPLDDSKEFTMRWIHSVELEPWEETFRIDDDLEIILDRTRFKAFGAGVPNQLVSVSTHLMATSISSILTSPWKA